MWMILLYGVATFMETGVGVWMFGRMFPERECESKVPSKIFLILLMYTTYTMAKSYLKLNQYGRFLLLLFYIMLLIGDILAEKRKDDARILKIKKVFLFSYMCILLSWQYWESYLSGGQVICGNLYIAFYLTTFWKCKFGQSYLWEIFYLVNLGFLKMLYIIIAGFIEHRTVWEYIYSGRYSVHSYFGAIYLIAICSLFWLLWKILYIKVWMQKLLEDYLKVMFLICTIECVILWLFMDVTGKIQTINIIIGIIIVTGVTIILLFAFIHFFIKSMISEKNILEVKNETIIRQYNELDENYKKYKCLIHDEKHMIEYISECIHTGNIDEIQGIVEKRKTEFDEQHYWTGVSTIDHIITIEKRKMDAMNIKFQLETDIENITIDNTDFIVLLKNLFDNAIEANSKSEQEKKIIFYIKNINDLFMLRIWNTSNKMPHVVKGKFITDKDDLKGHGWGLESVKYIVNKYEGNIEFKYGSDFFEVTIIVEK